MDLNCSSSQWRDAAATALLVSGHLHWNSGRAAAHFQPAPSGSRPPLRSRRPLGSAMDWSRLLICQRRPDQPMALQWEFPGGKIEPGEGPEQALVRELQEELGIRATIGPRVTHIRHNYRHGGAVDLQFFAVPSFEGELENKIFHQFKPGQARRTSRVRIPGGRPGTNPRSRGGQAALVTPCHDTIVKIQAAAPDYSKSWKRANLRCSLLPVRCSLLLQQPQINHALRRGHHAVFARTRLPA